MDYPRKDGTALREHLLQVFHQTGRWDDRLDMVQVPVEGEHLWKWYWEIRRDQAISLAEIEAFCRLNSLRLSPWEVGTLREMDAEFTAYISSKIPKPGGGRGHRQSINKG